MLFGKVRWTEKNLRSLGKVVSWRVWVSITNFLVAWGVSGSASSGLGVAAGLLVTNSILYFLHERTWNSIAWGKAEVETPAEEQPAQ